MVSAVFSASAQVVGGDPVLKDGLGGGLVDVVAVEERLTDL
jgi:hypothetical protein